MLNMFLDLVCLSMVSSACDVFDREKRKCLCLVMITIYQLKIKYQAYWSYLTCVKELLLHFQKS